MKEKKVLIVTYYFPPLGMGGVQRVTKFVKYLPAFGWKPYVLTVKDVEYVAKDPSLLDEFSGETQIIRTGSLDPLRILFVWKDAFRGRGAGRIVSKSATSSRWISRLFFPDSKVGWIPFALKRGLSLCRKEKIGLIFSTSPPPSAHLAAHLIKCATAIPWIADFRDPWIGYKLERFPTSLHLLLKKKLEKRILTNADRLVAASPVIQGELKGELPKRKEFRLISQGYDEEDFKDYRPSTPQKFIIGYLGTLSPDCNPEPAFRALGELIHQNLISKDRIRFLHVGRSIHLDVARLAQQFDLGEILESRGYLSHRNALNVMGSASLLLLVTSDDPRVFPAKVFEYLRLEKPILGIAPENSEIERLLRKMEAQAVVPPEDIEGIKLALLSSFREFEKGLSRFGERGDDYKKFERRALTVKLATLFDEVISS